VNPYKAAFREAVSAVGAEHVMRTARVFETVAESVADCSLVVGLTAAQRRELQQPIARLADGIPQVREHGGRVAQRASRRLRQAARRSGSRRASDHQRGGVTETAAPSFVGQ